jgi:hypothetical protein
MHVVLALRRLMAAFRRALHQQAWSMAHLLLNQITESNEISCCSSLAVSKQGTDFHALLRA